jgi:hypothetical protein
MARIRTYDIVKSEVGTGKPVDAARIQSTSKKATLMAWGVKNPRSLDRFSGLEMFDGGDKFTYVVAIEGKED